MNIVPPNQVGQTFVPTKSVLTDVEVAILTGNPGNGDDNITMKIKELGGQVLASNTVFVSDGFEGWLYFDIPGGGITVEPGISYVLQLEDTGKVTFGWKYNGDTYPHGNRVFFGSPQSGDFFFRTYGLDPGAVPINATVEIHPKSLNFKSKGKWITCYIELPEGYDVNDIAIETILLEDTMMIQHSDVQDGMLMVKFDRQAVIDYIEVVLGIIPPDDVTLTVTGELSDGTLFEGSDTIKVMRPGKDKKNSVPFTLYQSFPNPHNPETWIPYSLGKPVDVNIRIYNISGHPIRILYLDHKPAGFYTTKEKAAYWDGRNEAGEQVSSGVYFYTIQAGDFTATKKMIVAR